MCDHDLASSLPLSLLKVSIRQCSITETLESQVAGMCTIDLFHCGFQQWLCAPQHRAPQEEPREHTETQSRRCLQSVMSAVTICCSAAGLVLTVFCSHIEGVFSEHTRCILNTLTSETWCVCPQIYSQVFALFLQYCRVCLSLIWAKLLDGRLPHSLESESSVKKHC